MGDHHCPLDADQMGSTLSLGIHPLAQEVPEEGSPELRDVALLAYEVGQFAIVVDRSADASFQFADLTGRYPNTALAGALSRRRPAPTLRAGRPRTARRTSC